MPELGPYGSVRGARGNSRPYRESNQRRVKPTLLNRSRHSTAWTCAEECLPSAKRGEGGMRADGRFKCTTGKTSKPSEH